MEHEEKKRGRDARGFRIWVQGRLDEGFTEGLAGIEQEDVPAGTMLSGPLLDQSQMHSILDLLRSLGIDVLRFEIDPPPTAGYNAPPSAEAGRTDPVSPARVTTNGETR